MKSALLASAFLAVFPSALAAPQGPGNRPGLCYPSACGYWLVNNAGYTQSQIAQMRCGRSDTCNGEEWNSVYHMGIDGKYSGGSQFCSTGCYIWQEGICQRAGCH